MLRHVAASERRHFIIGTELGLLYPLRKANPDKRFYPASERMICRNMKKISPADVLHCLENMTGEVKVPEEIRLPAFQAVERMLALKI
jgi:quinolinate synthase